MSLLAGLERLAGVVHVTDGDRAGDEGASDRHQEDDRERNVPARARGVLHSRRNLVRNVPGRTSADQIAKDTHDLAHHLALDDDIRGHRRAARSRRHRVEVRHALARALARRRERKISGRRRRSEPKEREGEHKTAGQKDAEKGEERSERKERMITACSIGAATGIAMTGTEPSRSSLASRDAEASFAFGMGL